ncbi:MAG: endonuclease/exonuclease/phosphatase family protein [Proteobacteria bacterium]|nr:endonuclease/exonuclease/phosphatase family protein [Pseudomonadota bacterium]
MSMRNFWIVAVFVCAGMCGCDSDGPSEASLIVSPDNAMRITENGGTVDYAVMLGSKPTARVTVHAAAVELGTVSVSPYFFIDPTNWNDGGTIRVTCIKDELKGDRNVNITFVTSSLDPAYSGLTVLRTVTCAEDDESVVDPSDLVDPSDPVDPSEPVDPSDPLDPSVPVKPTKPHFPGSRPIAKPVEVMQGSLKVSATSQITSEDGDASVISVSLATRPEEIVAVFAKSMDISEGKVSPEMLLFKPDNWGQVQQFTVSGMDDDELDYDVEYDVVLSVTSSDPAYEDLDDFVLRMTNLDNEIAYVVPDGTPGVLVSPVGGLITSETGETAQFSVVLQSEPTAEVSIPVISLDETEGKTNVRELVFSPLDWDKIQTITLTVMDDDLVDGDVPYTVQLGPVSSYDERYDGMRVQGVAVKNIDNDIPDIPESFVLSAQKLDIEESGAPGAFTIALGTKPMGAVNVALSVSDDTEGRLSAGALTFTEADWDKPQKVEVFGVTDGIEDGSQTFYINFTITSADTRYDAYQISPVLVTSKDSDAHQDTTVKLRVMAANITSGNYQAYSPGHGTRIFQAVKPDIVLIQEFNYNNTNDSRDALVGYVSSTFGPEFEFTRGRGSIPNGVISRYPIIESGYWASNEITNRDWDWAVIDLPGPRELLVVSVHLSTDRNAREMPVLIQNIQNKVSADSKKGQAYFIMIGGDFNTSSRNPVIQHMSDVFVTGAPYPVDQKSNDGTNANRGKPYDYLLCSPDWCKYEIPVEIGTHTGNSAYPNGHVFDSRVYSKTKVGSGTELDYVPPVEANDSGASNMQHMAVICDFEYTY